MKIKPFLFGLIVLANNAIAGSLTQNIEAIELSSGGYIGVSVLNTETNKTWEYKGDQRFPMMSTFKTLACEKMLYD